MMSYIKHQIYKTIGTPNIIRIIEWRSLFEYLDAKGGERILDVACGWGTLCLKITEKGCEAHGIDLSKAAIEHANETMKNKFEMTGFSMVRSKYLLNSRITTFFCKIGINLRWSGVLWFCMFPMAYLCLISDRLFGVKDKGCTLIAEGRKN